MPCRAPPGGLMRTPMRNEFPRVALFRAREDAERTAARLRRIGFSAAILPAVEFVAPPLDMPEEKFDAVVATSARAFVREAEALAAAPLYVVGARTARAAKSFGFTLAAPPAPEAAKLIEMMTARLNPGARLIYLAGHDRKIALEAALKPRFALTVVEIYEARARTAWSASEARALASCVAALHYSRRSAELAARLANQAGAAQDFLRLRHVCLSADVAEPLAAIGAETEIARSPDEASLLKALTATAAMFPSHQASRI